MSEISFGILEILPINLRKRRDGAREKNGLSVPEESQFRHRSQLSAAARLGMGRFGHCLGFSFLGG